MVRPGEYDKADPNAQPASALMVEVAKTRPPVPWDDLARPEANSLVVAARTYTHVDLPALHQAHTRFFQRPWTLAEYLVMLHEALRRSSRSPI